MSFSKFYQRFKTRCTGFYYDTVRDDATSSYFEIIRSQITSIKIIRFLGLGLTKEAHTHSLGPKNVTSNDIHMCDRKRSLSLKQVRNYKCVL
jgi:hypothetical protein